MMDRVRVSLRAKWCGMKKRCYTTTSINYKDYGGRGITVCSEWLDSFEVFYNWAMTNGYSEGLELDRRDNDKGYSPDNCRFVTAKVNARNKRNSKLITIGNDTRTLAEWAEISGISNRTIQHRLRAGWCAEDLLKPVEYTQRYHNRFITVNGETKTVSEWAKATGISKDTLKNRLDKGWTEDKILSKPRDCGRGIK